METDDKATVREVGDLKLEMERRFGRVEKTLAVLLAVNVFPHLGDVKIDTASSAIQGVGLIVVAAILSVWHR
jgi:hypothetical protein